jgi:hypothetical protein
VGTIDGCVHGLFYEKEHDDGNTATIGTTAAGMGSSALLRSMPIMRRILGNNSMESRLKQLLYPLVRD